MKFRISSFLTVFCLFVALPRGAFAAAETNAVPPDAAARIAAENAFTTQALQAYLQFQEQVREAQAVIERARRETEAATLQNSLILSNRLELIEQSLAAQRMLQAKSIETMQGTGRFMLLVLGIFGGVSFVAIVLTAFFQWRTINRLGDITASMPAMRPMAASPVPALGMSEQHLLAAGAVEQTENRLLGAIERLEKRMAELEQASHTPLSEGASNHNGDDSEPADSPKPAAAPDFDAANKAGRIKSLLDEAQLLLNQDKPEEALARFDEALALDPNNTDALVKKGLAFEKVRKLSEAIDCYDRAIAADASLTIAYLHKGGLFNRMERFSEAVECYEQALRTQERRRAA